MSGAAVEGKGGGVWVIQLVWNVIDSCVCVVGVGGVGGVWCFSVVGVGGVLVLVVCVVLALVV